MNKSLVALIISLILSTLAFAKNKSPYPQLDKSKNYVQIEVMEYVDLSKGYDMRDTPVKLFKDCSLKGEPVATIDTKGVFYKGKEICYWGSNGDYNYKTKKTINLKRMDSYQIGSMGAVCLDGFPLITANEFGGPTMQFLEAKLYDKSKSIYLLKYKKQKLYFKLKK